MNVCLERLAIDQPGRDALCVFIGLIWGGNAKSCRPFNGRTQPVYLGTYTDYTLSAVRLRQIWHNLDLKHQKMCGVFSFPWPFVPTLSCDKHSLPTCLIGVSPSLHSPKGANKRKDETNNPSVCSPGYFCYQGAFIQTPYIPIFFLFFFFLLNRSSVKSARGAHLAAWCAPGEVPWPGQGKVRVGGAHGVSHSVQKDMRGRLRRGQGVEDVITCPHQ